MLNCEVTLIFRITISSIADIYYDPRIVKYKLMKLSVFQLKRLKKHLPESITCSFYSYVLFFISCFTMFYLTVGK